LNSQEVLIPEITSWDTPVTIPETARPGTTQFV
jgi:hypothetical protein